jgi:hypothetical protein
MGQTDAQGGDAVEHPAKDQSRRRHGGVEGIAQQVVQVVRAQAVAADDVDGVEEDRDAERPDPLEDRQERGIVQVPAAHVGAEVDAATAQLSHRALGLGGGGPGGLERKRRQADQPIGMRPGRLRHRVVHEARQPEPQRLVGPVHHRRHERQRVHRHPLRVHRLEPEVQVVVARRDRAEGDVADHDGRAVGTCAEADAVGLALRLDQPEISLGDEVGVDVHGGRPGHRRGSLKPRSGLSRLKASRMASALVTDRRTALSFGLGGDGASDRDVFRMEERFPARATPS